MMTDDEFNRLLGELTGGLPVTLAVTRLALALRALVDAGGDDARATLRNIVAARRRRDERGDDDEISPPPPPPRRR